MLRPDDLEYHSYPHPSISAPCICLKVRTATFSALLINIFWIFLEILFWTGYSTWNKSTSPYSLEFCFGMIILGVILFLLFGFMAFQAWQISYQWSVRDYARFFIPNIILVIILVVLWMLLWIKAAKDSADIHTTGNTGNNTNPPLMQFLS